MKILAIETSCDDTCVSIVEIKNSKLEILSNIVSSQTEIHKKYGGVFPFLAKREHERNLPVVFKKAVKKASSLIPQSESLISEKSLDYKFPIPKIDIIAVTAGPGLEPCLWQGVNFAKELAEKLKIPIIPINHIEAHILANFIHSDLKIDFPAVCLIVSGGHTQLILMKKIGKYQIIGETRDDAAGECFDKTARILGLGYPGGPIVAEMAAKFKNQKSKIKINLPRPMIYQKNYDFSFSGLKTAVLYDCKGRSPETKKSKKYRQKMCHEIQQAIIDVLIKKTIKAAKDYKAKSVVVGGGVAANKELKKQFQEKIKKEIPGAGFYIPDSKNCTDNALMVAITAYCHKKEKNKNWKKIAANVNLKIGKYLK